MDWVQDSIPWTISGLNESYAEILTNRRGSNKPSERSYGLKFQSNLIKTLKISIGLGIG